MKLVAGTESTNFLLDYWLRLDQDVRHEILDIRLLDWGLADAKGLGLAMRRIGSGYGEVLGLANGRSLGTAFLCQFLFSNTFSILVTSSFSVVSISGKRTSKKTLFVK